MINEDHNIHGISSDDLMTKGLN